MEYRYTGINTGIIEQVVAEIRGLMRDLAKLGCRTVTLLGGEFPLRPDWRYVAEAVKDGEMSLNLTPESYRAVCGVDGVGYGTATLKSPSISWPVTGK